MSFLPMKLTLLLGELKIGIRLERRRILKQVLTPQSHIDFCITGVHRGVDPFEPSSMFPKRPFLLNILPFDRGTVLVGRFNSNPLSMNLGGDFTSNQCFLHSDMALNHLFHPQESFVLYRVELFPQFFTLNPLNQRLTSYGF